MKRYFILLFVLLMTASCLSPEEKHVKEQINILTTEISDDLLNNLLPFWMKYTPDERGGFYGEVAYDGTPIIEADKAGILNARILWTFSSAYRIFGNEEYKKFADRAAEYYINHFIDKEYGGVFYELNCDGEPSDTKKFTYCIAFGIYALSEYYRATGNQESLEAAKELFNTFETHIYDKENGGYFETATRDWQKPEKGTGPSRMSKTMNTHIHVMEGFTNLYRVWPDETLRTRLFELLELLSTSDHLYNTETHHLIPYCDDDWDVVLASDSYGHDIETSWLLCETAEVLGDEAWIEKIKKQAIDMSSTALKEGLREDNAMKYEKTGDRLQNFSAWWCQNETVVGCINSWQITGDVKYLDQAVETWYFAKQYHVDKVNGGWFCNLKDDNSPDYEEMKVSTWNCPYHNSRMAYEVLARLINSL